MTRSRAHSLEDIMNDLAANSVAEQFTRPRANSLYEVMQMAEDQLQQPQSSCSSSSSSSASKPYAKGRPVSRLSLDRSKQAVAKKLSGKGHAQQPEERQPHHDAPGPLTSSSGTSVATHRSAKPAAYVFEWHVRRPLARFVPWHWQRPRPHYSPPAQD